MSDRAKLEEALDYYRSGQFGLARHLQTVIEAAMTHLAALPKTKMVEVWRVEFVIEDHRSDSTEEWEPTAYTYRSRARAEDAAKDIMRRPDVQCIRVTGPHQQEVPA